MIVGIVAVDANNGIGINGNLPWPKLKEDMAWFKSQTENQIVLMGSKTWKSLGKTPLPNRVNGVVSRHLQSSAHYNFFTPKYGLEFFTRIFPSKTVFVIGGQQIYDSTMEYIDKWLVTEIKETYHCDKFFDLKDVQKNFPNVKIIDTIPATEKNPEFQIVEYSK